MRGDQLQTRSGEARTLNEVLEMHSLLPLAWHAAAGAGRILVEERPDELRTSTKSSPTDTVTEMDTRCERFLIEALLADRPDDGLLGEEGGERPGTSGVRWVVDPLDGTVSYLYRLPMWGVSVAAEINGEVVVGVVLTPDFNEGYLAVRGKGAWHVRGGHARRMLVDDVSDLSMALVATGFGYQPQQRAAQARTLGSLLPRIRDLRRTGSAVVDFCWLARGRVDACYEEGLNHWDMAAGALIAQEAGVVVRSLNGNDFGHGVMVAAKPGIADALQRALIEAGGEGPFAP